MRPSRNTVIVGVVGMAILGGLMQWTLRAQDRPAPTLEPLPEGASGLAGQGPKLSIQDAMLRPFDLPFGQPTTLREVARDLEARLRAPVVLDMGALARQDLTPEDTVQLALKGVRLKTGLKILLNQVGLTFKVVPEDNLLLLTDAQESEESYLQILEEIKSLHRDMHTLQDTLDELLDEGSLEGGNEARVLKIKQPRAVRAL